VLVEILISIVSVVKNVGKLFINPKIRKEMCMKTSVIKVISKAKGVWNTVGSAD
jgi:murein endopeptidase